MYVDLEKFVKKNTDIQQNFNCSVTELFDHCWNDSSQLHCFSAFPVSNITEALASCTGSTHIATVASFDEFNFLQSFARAWFPEGHFFLVDGSDETQEGVGNR